MSGEPLRVAFRRQVRERALETAREMAVDRGWDRLRFGEIAERTGVSRPTLYKEFGSKQGLAEELVRREGEQFLGGVVAAMDEHRADPVRAVEAAVRYALAEGARNRLIRSVVAGPAGAGSLLPYLTTRRAPVFDVAAEVLRAWFAEHHPRLDADEVAETLDALIRLTVSHLILPGTPGTDPADPAEPGSADVPRRLARLAGRSLGLPAD